MIKAIIFDLDGVLIESKDIHFHALNKALKEVNHIYEISYNEHLAKYDGMSTSTKLNKLNLEKKLPKNKNLLINKNKQKYTIEILSNLIQKDNEIIKIINYYRKSFKIAIATNSIRSTLNIVLKNLKLENKFHYTISNEDVKNPKPHSEIYLKCMIALGVNPNEALIIEDSSVGIKSAQLSGANILPVTNIKKDVNIKNINKYISMSSKNNKKTKWISEKLNILIPLAGKGSRFQKQGYLFPKPLIEVNDKPMIQKVIENISIDANYFFIVLKEHVDKYNLNYVLKNLEPNCKIIVCDNITEGAACTSLLARKYIDNNNPLLIANSDQIIKWDSSQVMYSFANSEIDGGILTFESSHPKWSYAKVDKNNYVIEVAEKKPISNLATVGIYYWKKGSDYVKYADQMIKKNIRVNNEFYVCPVFNEAIVDSKKIITKNVEEMWGIGTPEDLNFYLSRNN
tara:strand:- start:1565 stop:2932 length:1368 start_codon:yes stop_codon:yes gene_type:complete